MREAKLAPTGRSPAWTSGRMKRSLPASHTGGSGAFATADCGAPPWPGPAGAGDPALPVCAAPTAGIRAAAGIDAMNVRRRMAVSYFAKDVTGLERRVKRDRPDRSPIPRGAAR